MGEGMPGAGTTPAQENDVSVDLEARMLQLEREIKEVREAVVHLGQTEGFLGGNDSDIRIHAEAQQRLLGMENELLGLMKK